MNPPDAVANLYVHSPFCRSRCPYCDFYSVEARSVPPASLERYSVALLREFELFAALHEFAISRPPATLYLGGGTPSLGKVSRYEPLTRALRLDAVSSGATEFTVEVNPDSATPEKLLALRALGANRFSVGVQSFDDRALRALGRIHDAAAARAAIARLRALPELRGAAVSLDLIFAIPGQTLAAWRRDLDEAIALAPDHISVYGLTYYEGTRLLEARRARDIRPADETLETAMFEEAHARLTAAGYAHYEISNYARSGRECRHNLAVWRGEAYLGLGAAAHSRAGRRRWSNPADIEAYCHAIERGQLPRAFAEEPTAGRSWRAERLMLELRTAQGVNLGGWPDAERRALLDDHGRDIDSLTAEGMAIFDGARLALTPKGWLVHDAIVRRFL